MTTEGTAGSRGAPPRGTAHAKPDANPGADPDANPGADPQASGDEDLDQQETHTDIEAQKVVQQRFSVPEPPRRTGNFVDAASLRAHVGDLLRTYLGGYEVDALGNITFTFEDARIFVTVGMSPVGPQVGVFSITNLDVELSPELAHFLLVTNHGLGFGAFSYDDKNAAVWLRHTLLGTTLDGPELQTAVAAISSTAAHFDELIKSRFGGRRFDEASQEVQDATSPPPPMSSGYL